MLIIPLVLELGNCVIRRRRCALVQAPFTQRRESRFLTYYPHYKPSSSYLALWMLNITGIGLQCNVCCGLVTEARAKKAQSKCTKTCIMARKLITECIFFFHFFDEVEACTRSERDGERRAGTVCAQSAQNELGKKNCATNVASLTGAGRGGSPYLSAKL